MPRPPPPPSCCGKGQTLHLTTKTLRKGGAGGVASFSLWQGGTSDLDMRQSLTMAKGSLYIKVGQGYREASI
jgi:hypothetical protein